MSVTVVYVEGDSDDDDAAFVFKDGVVIYSHHPVPKYGGNLDNLVEKLTGDVPEVMWLKQQAKPYPTTLEEFCTWPLHPVDKNYKKEKVTLS